MELFVNGVSAGTTAFSGTPKTPNNLRVGCRDTGSGDQIFFDGLIEEHDVWNAITFGGSNPTAALRQLRPARCAAVDRPAGVCSAARAPRGT